MSAVSFDAILGQAPAIGTLKRMLQSGRVHHALRFEGPDGVGKEMAAMAFAQALVCTAGEPLGCGQCSACRRAGTLCEGTPATPMHPDVILIERGLYPPEVLGRRTPEAQEISVDQIRSVVLERASYAPHEGRARLFIIRRAEELSISAANALLKTLEEPGRGTHFVLLVSRPAALPNTILSRTLRIRFAPLPDSVICSILQARGCSAERAMQVAAMAGGSASQALSILDAESLQARDQFVERALQALEAPDFEPSLKLAETQKDKRALRENLEALASRLACHGREYTLSDQPHARLWAVRYQVVLQAVRELERNASPALLVESMLMRLRAEVG